MFTIPSHKAEDTLKAGEAIGRSLRGGEILSLSGELGAGKTVLVRGVARGLSIHDFITSPTFVIVKSYPGRLILHHMDFYRLETLDDLESIGFEDFLQEDTVVAIEWAEKIPDAATRPFLHLTILYREGEERILRVECPGDPDREKDLKKILFSPSSGNTDR